jgi:heptosyltransferase-2
MIKIEKNKIDLSEINNVLVIQLQPFGDALLTTSYFQAIKKKIPNVQIHYLIKKKFQKAITNHPFIDNIIPIKISSGFGYYLERIKIIFRIRKEKYDLIIDQQNLPSTQIIGLLSGAKYRLGYEDARFSFAYNVKSKRGDNKYSASKKFDILLPLGIKEEKYELFFYISDGAKKFIDNWLHKNNLHNKLFICISPGTPVVGKKWRLSSFSRLSALIIEKLDYSIVIVWAPNEKSDAEEVFNNVKGSCILAPKTDLMEVSALIKKSKLLICNDGGLNHLAVAAKVKTLAIFGTTDVVGWSPASVFETHHHLFNDKIKNEDKDDSFGITPEDALAKVEKILTL